MSYAVVKNLENAFYVVPKKWLTKVDDDDKQYTFYPPSKLKKCVQDMKDIQDNWLTEEVKVIFNDCSDLQEANDFIELKCSYPNTEASELDKKKKKPKRKRENQKETDGESFNKMFDREAFSSQKNMKLEKNNEDQTVPSNENFNCPSPDVPFERTLSFQSSDSNQNNAMLAQNMSLLLNSQGFPSTNPPSTSAQFENSSPLFGKSVVINPPLHHNKSFPNTNFPSTSRSSANTLPYIGTSSNTIMMRRDIIEQLIEEVNILKVNQESIMQAINTINTTMRVEFNAIKGILNSQRNSELDIIYKPKVISCIDELNEMEKKLELMQDSFIPEYKKMHNYFSSSITLPNKGFGIQNGYIHSLMSMYLEKEFAKSFAWASTKQKMGFDAYKNHIKFFKSVCNKVVINGAAQVMFKNLTEVENSLQKFFKSIHQKPRALKSNTQITIIEKDGEEIATENDDEL